MAKLFWMYMVGIILYVLILVFSFYATANAVEICVKWCEAGTSATYDIGDIIFAQEDGADWGGLDGRTNPESCFVIVQVTDLTMSEFQQSLWNQPLYNLTDPDNPIRLKKRQFNFDKTNKIPQNVINFINNNDGFIQTDKAQVNSWINNKEGQF